MYCGRRTCTMAVEKNEPPLKQPRNTMLWKNVPRRRVVCHEERWHHTYVAHDQSMYMHMLIHVYIYIYTYVCISIYSHVCIYVRICTQFSFAKKQISYVATSLYRSIPRGQPVWQTCSIMI